MSQRQEAWFTPRFTHLSHTAIHRRLELGSPLLSGCFERGGALQLLPPPESVLELAGQRR